MAAVEGAVFDLGTRVIGDPLLLADLAIDRARVGEDALLLSTAGGDQVAGPAVDRDVEFRRRKARPGDDRLVIPGEEAPGVFELGNAQRFEIVLQEGTRLLGVQTRRGTSAPGPPFHGPGQTA